METTDEIVVMGDVEYTLKVPLVLKPYFYSILFLSSCWHCDNRHHRSCSHCCLCTYKFLLWIYVVRMQIHSSSYTILAKPNPHLYIQTSNMHAYMEKHFALSVFPSPKIKKTGEKLISLKIVVGKPLCLILCAQASLYVAWFNVLYWGAVD